MYFEEPGVSACADNTRFFFSKKQSFYNHFRTSGDAAGGFLRRAHFRSASLSRLLWLLSCSVQESNMTALAIKYTFLH